MNAEEISKYLDIAKNYGKFFADIYFHPVIFFVLVLIIISVYVIRYCVFIFENKTEAINKGVYKEYKLYIMAHMSLQLLICFLCSYVVIKFSNALIDSYIINWILAPTVGLFAGIIIDMKVIIPLENKTDTFTNPIVDKKDEKKKGNNNESANSINNITINVGSKEKSKDKSNDKEAEIESMDNTINIKETNDDIIRTLVNIQEEQGKQLQDLASVIDAMRENIVTNMRFELHDCMMESVLRGYVTPEEYDRISSKMVNYKSLGGNHGIDNLYNEKFKNLPIR